MTLAALTPEAEGNLTSYLGRLRSSLRGQPSVDVDEVESDVREHIAAHLGERSEPVSAIELGAILDELGDPEEWGSDREAIPWWRRSFERLTQGPNDWRLGAICLVTFVVALLLVPTIGPVLLVASYLLSRAVVAWSEQRGEPLGAARWLVLPPIVALALPAAVLLLIGPAIALAPLAASPNLLTVLNEGVRGADQIWVRFLVIVPLGMGLWWLVVGLSLTGLHRRVAWLLFPVLNWLRPRHAVGLTWAGLGAFLIGLTAVFVF